MLRISSLITFLLLAFVFISSSQAQVIGQIFTKEEAQKRYGDVKISIPFSTRDLQIELNKTDDYIMFNVIEKQLYILNGKREVLYPTGGIVQDNQPFYFFSKDIVRGLVEFCGNEPNVNIELREKVLSISYGAFVLNLAGLCPPICP